MEKCDGPVIRLTTGWLVCPECEGNGVLLIGSGRWQSDAECPDCGGNGWPPYEIDEDDGSHLVTEEAFAWHDRIMLGKEK
jgi:DnaJ-class molecular chaperone